MNLIDIQEIPSVKKLLQLERVPISQNIKKLINLSYDWAKENNKEILQFVYVPLGIGGTYNIVYLDL